MNINHSLEITWLHSAFLRSDIRHDLLIITNSSSLVSPFCAFPSTHRAKSSRRDGSGSVPRILHPSPYKQTAGKGLLAGGQRRWLVPSSSRRLSVHTGGAERANSGQPPGGDWAPYAEDGPTWLCHQGVHPHLHPSYWCGPTAAASVYISWRDYVHPGTKGGPGSGA